MELRAKIKIFFILEVKGLELIITAKIVREKEWENLGKSSVIYRNLFSIEQVSFTSSPKL